MPSPFPGMDPYLEGAFWTVFHANLIDEIARQLAPRLLPRYLALVEKRFVIATPEESTTTSIYPDLGIPKAGNHTGTTATAIAEPPLSLDTVVPEKIPHRTLEIRDVAERRLVTAIEMLSPTNKRGEGREEYLEKRQQVLMSSAHLVELDFLRKGRRVPMRQPLPSVPYFVLLSRAERRPRVGIWPIGLREHLPTIPIPLLQGDADVLLDLQLALTTIYNLFGYNLALDYTQPPEVPLDPEDAAWAAEQVRIWREGRPS
jgi:hypothetical protein